MSFKFQFLLRTLFRPWFLCSLLIVLAGAIAWAVSFDGDCRALLCRGDFPAFYSAALLADSEQLYELTMQQVVQSTHWPSLEGRFLYFAYPPYTALLYAPLRFLTAAQAKLLFVLSSLIILACSAYLLAAQLRKLLPAHAGVYLSAFVYLLCFPQTFIAIAAGQNASWSMLLFTLILCSESEARRGVASGLLWFKPQFALFVALGLLFSSRHKALLYSLPVAVLLYLLASVFHGFEWPLDWFAALRDYSVQELAINSHRSLSIPSLLNSVAPQWVSYLVQCVLLSHLIYLTRSFRDSPRQSEYTLALWAIAALLLSPRTMFYDFAIVLPGVLLLTEAKKKLFVALLVYALLAALFAGQLESLILCFALCILYTQIIQSGGLLKTKP